MSFLLLLPAFLIYGKIFVDSKYQFKKVYQRIFEMSSWSKLGMGFPAYKSTRAHVLIAVTKPNLPEGLHYAYQEPIKGIFVIGESATRSHHQLFGYPGTTNPQLMAIRDELFLFDNVISSSQETIGAVRHMLSFATREKHYDCRVFLHGLAAACGFQNAHLSGHKRTNVQFGNLDLDLFFANAKVIKHYCDGQNICKDELLYPILKPIITQKATQCPELITIQLMGSHAPFRTRYPKDFPKVTDGADKLYPEKNQDVVIEYDTTIANTDMILAQMIDDLRQLHQPAFLVYLSDHGESVYPEMPYFRLRDPSIKTTWEVPLIVWLSEEYIKIRPDLPPKMIANMHQSHQTDRLLFALCDLLGITWKDFPQHDNLFSEEYIAKPRFWFRGEVFSE